ncbi:Hvo_1808 family surface protein [Halovenus rubra]|uniref:Hvo_1808 family surface protein n=2 Tax=Halovenus rubra TaxID=869890 RepID=A0ACC7DY79_9EURY
MAADTDSEISTDSNYTVAASVVESDIPDPPADTLGWENGVWANATLSIDQSNGINQTELKAVVARTMARVETVRGIEFDRTPPVRVIYQQQQRNETDEQNYSETYRTQLNTQYESLFLINQSQNAVESRRVLFGSGVSAYYSPESRDVTMISPNASVLQIQEGVLSQELFHAQQDNQFTLPWVETIEERNTRNGYVEGDANYVQNLYEQRCTDEWDETCYRPERSASPQLSGLNDGMHRLFRQPYESGYAFVRERHQQQGWKAVNTLYENPPASTEQIIHPAAYREDEPTSLTITDTSSEAWKPLKNRRKGGERVTSSVGEAGLYVSMVSPAMEMSEPGYIIPRENHLIGGFRDAVQLGYNHSVTAGWDGDRLLPYVTSEGDKTGYIYKTRWDSHSDAKAFHRAYRKLLAYHDANAIDGRANTYRIPQQDGFTDAFYVERNGSQVRVVNAPTVDALQAVARGAAPSANESQTVEPWQQPEQKWQTAVPGRTSDFSAAADGMLHLATLNGTIRAVNETTGTAVWTHQLNEGIIATPAVVNGTAYVGTTQSTVIALDGQTGAVQWQKNMSGSFIGTPRVENNTVYVGSTRSRVAALNATTGEKQWIQSTDGPVTASLKVTNSHVLANSRDSVSAFNQSTGKTAWNMTVNGSVLTAPMVEDEMVYAASFNGQNRSSQIHAVDAVGGERRWRQKVNGTVSSLTEVTATRVYAVKRGVTSGATTLLSFNRQHGSQHWQVTLNESVSTVSVSPTGTVYAGTSGGQLHAIDVDSGEYRFTNDIGGSVTRQLVVSNNTLYVGSDAGLLMALNGSTGDRQWTFVTNGLLPITPIATDEQVYAQTGKSIYSLESADKGGDSEVNNRDETPSETTPNSAEQTQTPSSTDTDSETDSPASTDVDNSTPSTDDNGPGLGLVTVAVALLAVTLVSVLKGRH